MSNTYSDIMVFLSELPDTRYDRCKLHKLSDMIYMVLFAMLCGAVDWDDICDTCHAHCEYLKERLHIRNGIPSACTFKRVFNHISQETMQKILSLQVEKETSDLSGKIIAIDGKSLRGSRSDTNAGRALHALNAFITETKTVIRQEVGDCKEAELTMLPKLLSTIDPKGATITLDALSCQHSVTQIIREKKADYLIGLKSNQPQAHADAILLFEKNYSDPSADVPVWTETDKGHGRVETRSYACLDISGLKLESMEKFVDIHTIVRVNSIVEKKGGQTQEYRYYITSHKPDPHMLGEMVRAHWAIENSLHYILDVIYHEDDNTTRSRNLAANFSLIRKICKNAVEKEKAPKETYRRVMKRLMLDPHKTDSFIQSIVR